MIKPRELLRKMTEHLSDWLVMRRNPESTNGGKILFSVANEVCDMEKAIEEYVKTYFISNYIDKTHEIAYEYMQIHVGAIDINKIEIINLVAPVCNSKHEFETTCNSSYFEDGYIYFKPYQVQENDIIIYKIENREYSQKVKRVPIWNVFDEFAMYVGLERMDRENNKCLLERILYQSQNPINSTIPGIQNAIANIANIQKEDIKVEKIDEKNAYLSDYTGETIFEKLTQINRDIYRTKRWNVDYWQHDMDFSTYIPHDYDVQPAYYQDGIGDNDDLKIAITKKDEIVHAEIRAYQKDEKVIQEFYKKYPLDTETVLKLYKPDETLQPIEIESRIDAGTLTKINDTSLKITYTASRTICEKTDLRNLIDTPLLEKESIYDFQDGHTYRFKITPLSFYCNYGAVANYNNESLLEENESFYINDFKQLAHRNTSLYVNQLYYFSECARFSHELGGFKLKNLYRDGRLTLPLKDMQNKKLRINVKSPDYTPVYESALSYKDFIQEDEERAYVNILNKDSLFAIREIANSIQFKIEGEAIVFVRDEENPTETKVSNNYFRVGANNLVAKDYNIHIIPTDVTQQIRISDISYTKFNVQFELSNGTIEDNTLPDYSYNELHIDVTTHVTDSPLIEYIWIGTENLENTVYYTKSFEYENGHDVYIHGDEVQFTIEDLTDETSQILKNTFDKYISTKVQEIPLSLDQYEVIESITTDSGVPIIKKDGKYYISFQAHQSVAYILIKGVIVDYIKQILLSDIIHMDSDAEYYLSPVIDSFIEVKDDIINIVDASFDALYGRIELTNYEPFIPVFKKGNHLIESSFCNAPIDKFYLKASNSKTYIAYNKHLMYEERDVNIPVDKNFSPLLPYDEILFYKIESLTPNAKVFFYNEKQSEEAQESLYSIDLKPLSYKVEFSLVEQIKHLFQEVVFKFRLNKNIKLPNYLTNAVGDSLHLKEYLIDAEEGFEVMYTSPTEEDIRLDPSLLQTERFVLNTKSFKKLKCCHIDEILYCGFEPYTENAESTIEEFELIKQTGVMYFQKEFSDINAGRVVYIHYTVKRPDYLVASLDKLYTIKNVSHRAYMHVFTKDVVLEPGENKYENELFKKSDFVTIQIKEPGYIATCSQKEGLITIIENIPRDRITVHKGYYYSDGEEYYCFGDSSNSYVEYRGEYVQALNAQTVEDGLLFHIKSENLIKNSMFKTKPLATLFSTNFNELEHINYFKRLSACEQINLWDHCNSKIELNKGLYGAGIHYAPMNPNILNFIGLEIKQINKDIELSFWLKSNKMPTIYVQSQIDQEAHLTLTTPTKVLNFTRNGYIHHVTLPYEEGIFYYLVLNGEGIIDDLIMCEKELYKENLHEKNLTKMFMPAFEVSKNKYQRLLFNHQNGYKGTMEMLENGDVVATSNMSYGFTKLLQEDWMNHAILQNTQKYDNCIVPTDQNAYVKTPIVRISNRSYIKEVLIRVNFFSNTNTTFNIYTGASESTMHLIGTSETSSYRLSNIEDYVQIELQLKEPLYSLDISASYIEGATPETYQQNYFESELFDLGHIARYLLSGLYFDHFKDAKVFLRVGKTDDLLDDYEEIKLDQNGELIDMHHLGRIRYIQFKIYCDSYFNLKYFDVEDIGDV